MKKIVRYQCSFCKRKIAARPETILKHEAECMHNPDGKNCYLCKFSVLGGAVDTPFGEMWDEKIPYCELEGIPLPHLRAEGFTALNCEHFVRDSELYEKRSGEDVQREIEKIEWV